MRLATAASAPVGRRECSITGPKKSIYGHAWGAPEETSIAGVTTRKCRVCGTSEHWPRASDPCLGKNDSEPLAGYGPQSNRRTLVVVRTKHKDSWLLCGPSALRTQVEAAGVGWEAYRGRRRRGLTHAEAMAYKPRAHSVDNPANRAAAERAGVTWSKYVKRRKSGWSHEAALHGRRSRDPRGA